MHFRFFLTAFLQVLLACALLSRPAHAAPLEDYAALPSFISAKLSPDGKKISYISSDAGRRALMVLPLDGSAQLLIPSQQGAEIIGHTWANDHIILQTLTMSVRRPYYRNKLVRETRIVAYDIHKKTAKWLGKPIDNKGLGGDKKQYASQTERIVSLLPKDKDHILLQLDFYSGSRDQVYKVNLNSGKRSVVKAGNDGVQYWFADHSGEVRLGVGTNLQKNRRNTAIIRDAAGNWQDITQKGWFDNFDVHGFSQDPNIIFVRGLNEHGTHSFYSFDLSKGTILEQIAQNPAVDMDWLDIDKQTGTLLGYSYDYKGRKFIYTDPNFAALQKAMSGAFPGATVRVADYSPTTGRYLILSANPGGIGTYYLYDQQQSQLSAISPVREGFAPQATSMTQSITINMRDKTDIEAILSLPITYDGVSRLPFVVMPHGGPHSRASGDWSYDVQFLIDKGYGVLQPNFRGSTGFGQDFMLAGKQQWGGLMQQDVQDSTLWLSQQGFADPGRICVMGGSYGGYAALMASLEAKQLFKCAISINGVSDLPALKEHDKGYISSDNWVDDMGLVGAKDEEVSPIHQASRVNIPVLLIAAKDDSRVPFDQSKSFFKKLKSLGKPVKYEELKEGEHALHTEASRERMLKAVDKFLTKHLGK